MPKKKLYVMVWKNGENNSRDQIVSTHDNGPLVAAKCERLNAPFRADISSAAYGFHESAGFYVQQQWKTNRQAYCTALVTDQK